MKIKSRFFLLVMVVVVLQKEGFGSRAGSERNHLGSGSERPQIYGSTASGPFFGATKVSPAPKASMKSRIQGNHSIKAVTDMTFHQRHHGNRGN
jgi:hypothetical protein